MWWDVGWVRWGQEAAKGFLAPDEQVRTVFPAWFYLDPPPRSARTAWALAYIMFQATGVPAWREKVDVVVLLTDRELYVIREGGSSTYLNYGEVLVQHSVGSFNARLERDGRREVLVVVDRLTEVSSRIYFTKDQADPAREIVAAGTDASTRGQGHD